MAIKNPSVLYEINTRVFLNKLSAKYKIPVTLANVPDEEMQKLAGLGIESVWLMGVWERSPGSSPYWFAGHGTHEFLQGSFAGCGR
jgi:hypothetical protein